jgi:hypothetical protein
MATDDSLPRSPRRTLISFFAHPSVGIIGTVASVIGIPLAIYFYVASRATPDLTSYVNPVRTEVVKHGTVSELTVLFKGAPISSDITATQVAIWNAGRAPIRREDVLTPVSIHVDAPILEATLRKRTRAVTNLAVDTSDIRNGTVRLTWRILEGGDGGVVQLIYAGDVDRPISVDGTIVGQPRLHQISTGIVRTTKVVQGRLFPRQMGYFMLVAGILIAAFWTFRTIHRVRTHTMTARWAVKYALSAGLYLVTGAVLIYISPPAGPPFGF